MIDSTLYPFHEAYSDAYVTSDRHLPQTIDDAYAAARAVLVAAGYPVSNGDPAEDVIGALVRYIVQSLRGGYICTEEAKQRIIALKVGAR